MLKHIVLCERRKSTLVVDI